MVEVPSVLVPGTEVMDGACVWEMGATSNPVLYTAWGGGYCWTRKGREVEVAGMWWEGDWVTVGGMISGLEAVRMANNFGLLKD